MNDSEGPREEQGVVKRMKLSDTPLAPKEGHCHAWIQRKKRFCKMTVGMLSTLNLFIYLTNISFYLGRKRKYCGEHAASEENCDEDLRVPCPLGTQLILLNFLFFKKYFTRSKSFS